MVLPGSREARAGGGTCRESGVNRRMFSLPVPAILMTNSSARRDIQKLHKSTHKANKRMGITKLRGFLWAQGGKEVNGT